MRVSAYTHHGAGFGERLDAMGGKERSAGGAGGAGGIDGAGGPWHVACGCIASAIVSHTEGSLKSVSLHLERD